MNRRAIRYSLTILAAAATLALPSRLDGSQLTLYILLGLAAMVTLGLSLLLGYAGQVCLGQATFYATGGYAAGLVTVHTGQSLIGLGAAPVRPRSSPSSSGCRSCGYAATNSRSPRLPCN